jgi:hypothetical protein
MNALIIRLSSTPPFSGDLDYYLVRASMVFTFIIFGYQKWFSFEAHQIAPFTSHSPLAFWLIPAFGVRGASFFLGTTEWTFGTLIFLGFWSPRLGALGALGSIRYLSRYCHHYTVVSQRVGGGGRWLSSHVSAGGILDEGRRTARRLDLFVEAGCDACRAGGRARRLWCEP